MSCTISLGPDNDLELITPSGRRLYVPIGPHSTKWLFDILWNASRRTEAPGFVNHYPTQAIIKTWQEEAARVFDEGQTAAKLERAKERAKAIEAKYGISLDDMEL